VDWVDLLLLGNSNEYLVTCTAFLH